MIIEKNKSNGSIIISDIINNQYIKQVYYFYTLKECKVRFKEYIKNLTK